MGLCWWWERTEAWNDRFTGTNTRINKPTQSLKWNRLWMSPDDDNLAEDGVSGDPLPGSPCISTWWLTFRQPARYGWREGTMLVSLYPSCMYCYTWIIDDNCMYHTNNNSRTILTFCSVASVACACCWSCVFGGCRYRVCIQGFGAEL